MVAQPELTLDREVSLEARVGVLVVEDLLEGRVLQCGTVDISRDPDHCQRTAFLMMRSTHQLS